MTITARQSDSVEVKLKTRLVVLIGIASGALYWLIYSAQRAIYLNGLSLNIEGIVVQGTAASRVWLLGQAAAYYSGTVALFALYFWLLLLCHRGQLRDRRTCTLALLFPVLFNLGLLFGQPYLSNDVFSYMAHGYLGVTPGNNPYVEAAREVVNTPFGQQLVPWGWQPVHGISPYGPLWTRCEIAILQITQHIPFALLLFKSLVIGASLLTASLIWRILGRVRPKDQLLGTLVYLWNPMIIVEFAAEGHNDALMIVFVLLSLLFAVQARPTGSVAALMLGVLTKYVPLIFLPAQVVYFWRDRNSRWSKSQLTLRLLLGLAIGLGLAVLLYQPLWVGVETFRGVREANWPQLIASTRLILSSYLQQFRPEAEATQWASRILKGIFVAYVLIASLRVRDEASLLRTCGSIALVYLLVASPIYWPWYATTSLALMALSPYGTFRWMIFVLTLGSRLVAPLDLMVVNGFIPKQVKEWDSALIALALPLLIFLMLSVGSAIARQRRESLVE
jgi:alpha-1,6-mannosyltransferase